MKKHLWILLCILWGVLVGIYFYRNAFGLGLHSLYTIENDAVKIGEDYLFMENTVDSGYLFKVDGLKCNVEEMFATDDFAKETYVGRILSDDGLYVLLKATTRMDGKPIDVFNIIKLNENLRPVQVYKWFRPYNNGEFTSFTSDSEYLYLTHIAEDGSEAELYGISKDLMKDIDPDEDYAVRNVALIKYSDLSKATESYHLIYGQYIDGSMNTVENGIGLKIDEIYSEEAAEIFQNMHLSFKHILKLNEQLFWICVIVGIVGILFIISVFAFFRQRNRVAYMILIWEMMLAFVIGAGYFLVVESKGTQRAEEYRKFAGYSLDEIRDSLTEYKNQYREEPEFYYYSENYLNLARTLQKHASTYDNGEVFRDICVVDVKSCATIASSRGYEGYGIQQIYGINAVEAIVKNVMYSSRQSAEGTLNGQKFHFVSIGEPETEIPEVVVLGVLRDDVIEEDSDISNRVIALWAIGLFVLASLGGIIALLLQASDLRKLGESMNDLSSGERDIVKPRYVGEDVGDMWNGLLDIGRNIKNLNYTKYRVYEAYYRFAPKSVEKILGKDSITEVSNGEMVKCQGTVALIDTDMDQMLRQAKDMQVVFRDDGKGILKSLKNALKLMSEYQESGRGFNISTASDLSQFQLVFPEGNRKCIDFGIDFVKCFSNSDSREWINHLPTVFLHFVDYEYGVTGDENQSFQFLISPQIMDVEQFLPKLNELKVRLVITQSVFDRETEKFDNRYIGFVETLSGEKVKLYEVLEAYPDIVRRARLETKSLFEEGMELFLQHNFYLARNNFAQILKVDSTDEVARWYVFTCEKYLDADIREVRYGLNQ